MIGSAGPSGFLGPEIERIARGSFKEKSPPEIKGTGYVVNSLQAALWALHRSDNFKEGCLLAANLGDDADITATIEADDETVEMPKDKGTKAS